MPGRLARLLSAGVAVVVLLGACSDDAQPKTEPSSSPSPAASPSASPEATTPQSATPAPAVPTLPPEARARTPEAAAAFARHWFKVLDYAYATGDVEQLRAVSDGECESCMAFISQIEGRTASGGSFRGGGIDVSIAEASPLDASQSSLVSIGYSQQPLVEVAADGSIVNEGSSESGTLSFYALYQESGWTAFGVTDG
jgi:Family of unknown function (DUF6318)